MTAARRCAQALTVERLVDRIIVTGKLHQKVLATYDRVKGNFFERAGNLDCKNGEFNRAFQESKKELEDCFWSPTPEVSKQIRLHRSTRLVTERPKNCADRIWNYAQHRHREALDLVAGSEALITRIEAPGWCFRELLPNRHPAIRGFYGRPNFGNNSWRCASVKVRKTSAAVVRV
jgi:hypothetical protein